MIVGIVRGREPLIRVTIRGLRGRQQEIEAVVDSGYTGLLTLPPTAITALSLRWQTFGRGVLADGTISVFDVYQARVVWDGRVRPVFVDEFDATPLVGMALLRGYEYRMQVRARGMVTIKRLPQRPKE
jgi:clan AA aspartic protease